MTYNDFLYQKNKKEQSKQIVIDREDLHPSLFEYEKDLVLWALNKGRAALFTMTGTGKTLMQLAYAEKVYTEKKVNVLILAPLGVVQQTIREAKEKLDLTVLDLKKNDFKNFSGINITNYENLHNINSYDYGCIILDESSIIKNYSGKIRNTVIDLFHKTQYRLCCTATPAPNDYMEIGNTAEFLGIMKRKEMLSMFFVHDSSDTQKWRLKKHAEGKFWDWLSSWAVVLVNPSDLGYSDARFTLPELVIREVVIPSDHKFKKTLFATQAETLDERREARKLTINEKVKLIAENINNSNEIHIVWCDLNIESDKLKRAIKDSVEVKGSDSSEHKEKSLLEFTQGKIKCLISKPSICGFGLNFQVCHNVHFIGLSDSFEDYFQAVRRCWRFGQKEKVIVNIYTSILEGSVYENIKRKEFDFLRMVDEMRLLTIENVKNDINKIKKVESDYNPGVDMFVCSNLGGLRKNMKVIDQKITDDYSAYCGDNVEVLQGLKDGAVDYAIFSPPFADLYCYSDSDRDMGNSKNYDEFWKHFTFLVAELKRVVKKGRLVSIHCMNIPALKERDGYIGIKDFKSDIIKAFQDVGFIYHSDLVIWKDPLLEAVRTKSLGLLHKQLCKDSSLSRQGLPDYIITMRNGGENSIFIAKPEGFKNSVYAGSDVIEDIEGVERSHLIWRKYASPVWMDIRQTNVLNKNDARGEKDEKHICPLQLDVIDRCVELWSNPGEVVLDPFGGIGSSGARCIELDRKAIIIELKKVYYAQSIFNLDRAVKDKKLNIFGGEK